MSRTTIALRGLLGVIVLSLGFGTALAHHFKGLPHFSYFENYPQVPQDEFLGQQGDYEYSLVLYDFQGLERGDKQQPDNARFYLIVYDMRESDVYVGPLTVEILDHGEVTHAVDFEAPQEECVYSFHRELPSTGRYSLAVTHRDEGGTRAIIPFRLSSQRVPWGKWITAGLVILVVVVAIGSRRARVAIDRREAHLARQGR